MHGFGEGPEDWFHRSETGQHLPDFLANNGYDVWIGTARGAASPEYSDHTTLDAFANYTDYWNFTIDTMAAYDLPAMINYVSEYSHSKNISFLGHNLGASTMFKAMAAGTMNK
jgi:alpha-beta hydrolase superfamily lysophospholipase